MPDDTNQESDVFVHDLVTGMTTRESLGENGDELGGAFEPSISADGRFVAFVSNGAVGLDNTDQADVYVRDRLIGTIELVSVWSDGSQSESHARLPVISGDGRFVAFRTNQLSPADPALPYPDTYLHDRATGETVWLSEHAFATEELLQSHDPVISLDGRVAAFSTELPLSLADGDPYFDVYLYDVDSGQRTLLSAAATSSNGGAMLAGSPSLSAKAEWLVYTTFHYGTLERRLVLADLQSGSEAFIDPAPTGFEIDGIEHPTLVGNGASVVFAGEILEPYTTQIFTHDVSLGTTTLVTRSSAGALPGYAAYEPAISADGATVVFRTRANDLGPLDTNDSQDIYAMPVP